MPQGFVLAATCEQTVSLLIDRLTQQGYRPKRSFDLRDALHHQPNCSCPYHGTSECNCQYVVLLIYEQTRITAPAAITIHECDGITQVRLIDMPVVETSAQPLLTALTDVLTALTEVLNSVPIEA